MTGLGGFAETSKYVRGLGFGGVTNLLVELDC